MGVTPDWREAPDRGCVDVPKKVMYPAEGDAVGEEAAKAVCAHCPVKGLCLEFAVVNGERFGVWGGAGEWTRRTLRARYKASLRKGPPKGPMRAHNPTGPPKGTPPTGGRAQGPG